VKGQRQISIGGAASRTGEGAEDFEMARRGWELARREINERFQGIFAAGDQDSSATRLLIAPFIFEDDGSVPGVHSQILERMLRPPSEEENSGIVQLRPSASDHTVRRLDLVASPTFTSALAERAMRLSAKYEKLVMTHAGADFLFKESPWRSSGSNWGLTTAPPASRQMRDVLNVLYHKHLARSVTIVMGKEGSEENSEDSIVCDGAAKAARALGYDEVNIVDEGAVASRVGVSSSDSPRVSGGLQHIFVSADQRGASSRTDVFVGCGSFQESVAALISFQVESFRGRPPRAVVLLHAGDMRIVETVGLARALDVLSTVPWVKTVDAGECEVFNSTAGFVARYQQEYPDDLSGPDHRVAQGAAGMLALRRAIEATKSLDSAELQKWFRAGVEIAPTFYGKLRFSPPLPAGQGLSTGNRLVGMQLAKPWVTTQIVAVEAAPAVDADFPEEVNPRYSVAFHAVVGGQKEIVSSAKIDYPFRSMGEKELSISECRGGTERRQVSLADEEESLRLPPKEEYRCIPCVEGSFRDAVGSVACVSCPRGTFSGDPGAQSCTPCFLDTIADRHGQTSCTSCPLGFSTHGREGQWRCEKRRKPVSGLAIIFHDVQVDLVFFLVLIGICIGFTWRVLRQTNGYLSSERYTVFQDRAPSYGKRFSLLVQDAAMTISKRGSVVKIRSDSGGDVRTRSGRARRRQRESNDSASATTSAPRSRGSIVIPDEDVLAEPVEIFLMEFCPGARADFVDLRARARGWSSALRPCRMELSTGFASRAYAALPQVSAKENSAKNGNNNSQDSKLSGGVPDEVATAIAGAVEEASGALAPDSDEDSQDGQAACREVCTYCRRMLRLIFSGTVSLMREEGETLTEEALLVRELGVKKQESTFGIQRGESTFNIDRGISAFDIDRGISAFNVDRGISALDMDRANSETGFCASAANAHVGVARRVFACPSGSTSSVFGRRT